MKPRNEAAAPSSDWPELHRWISWFIESKPAKVRQIYRWHGWAKARLTDGWTLQQTKDAIIEAWDQWVAEGRVDMTPMPAELVQSLAEVHAMAEKGATPEACAVVYRSLAREYPSRHWLTDWANRWEAAGNDWKAVVMP